MSCQNSSQENRLKPGLEGFQPSVDLRYIELNSDLWYNTLGGQP